jgi:hypothetical protein
MGGEEELKEAAFELIRTVRPRSQQQPSMVTTFGWRRIPVKRISARNALAFSSVTSSIVLIAAGWPLSLPRKTSPKAPAPMRFSSTTSLALTRCRSSRSWCFRCWIPGARAPACARDFAFASSSPEDCRPSSLAAASELPESVPCMTASSMAISCVESSRRHRPTCFCSRRARAEAMASATKITDTFIATRMIPSMSGLSPLDTSVSMARPEPKVSSRMYCASVSRILFASFMKGAYSR